MYDFERSKKGMKFSMKESFIRFNLKRMIKYIDYLEKRHKTKKEELKAIKEDYLKQIKNIERENKKVLEEKNKIIKTLMQKIQETQEEVELYENKLNIIPGFIVNKFNKI